MTLHDLAAIATIISSIVTVAMAFANHRRGGAPDDSHPVDDPPERPD